MAVPVPQRRAVWEGPSTSVPERSTATFLHSEPDRRRLVAAGLGVAEADVGGVAVENWRQRLLRITVFLRVELSGRPVRLVAKLDPDGLGERAFRVIRALRAAGLAPPAEATVPDALGHRPEAHLLLLERAPGRTWLEEVLSGEAAGAAASERAADWLLALQGLELPLLAGRRAPASSFPAAGLCRDLADRLPELAPDLRSWPRRLSGRWDRVGEIDAGSGATSVWMPSHGDFHPKNLLVTPGRTTAVDLDDVGYGDPAADVGTALAQLLAMAFFETGHAGAGARAGSAFWERWARRAAGRGAEERVTLHALATLLGVLHYSYALDTPHRDLAHRWLPGLEAWWAARRGGVTAGLARFAEST